jgi:Spx/MgsR family transcriptional regulator
MATTMYGIPNCDTIKKARAFLDANGIDYVFHDYKKQGVPADALAHWVERLGWEPLLNRRGPTWHKLDPSVQATVQDAVSAQAVMRANASVIKRPVLVFGGELLVGFDPGKWATHFG